MSFTDELLVLFGKNVTRDAQGLNARLHCFGSISVDDGTPFRDRRIHPVVHKHLALSIYTRLTRGFSAPSTTGKGR